MPTEGYTTLTPQDVMSFYRDDRNERKEREVKQLEELAKRGITRYKLYGGSVYLDFNPKSEKYRYTVTAVGSTKGTPVRGVTSCIKNILDKPGLREWPLNMFTGEVFGATWVDSAKRHMYNADNAVLKPGEVYTADQYDAIMQSGIKAHTRRSDRGKDVGHLVHSAVEKYLKNEKSPVEAVLADSIPEEPQRQDYEVEEAYTAAYERYKASKKEWEETKKVVTKAFGAFKGWWASLPRKKIIAVEQPVYSMQLGYAGTFDLAVEIGGKPFLLDLKTTNRSRYAPLGIYPEYFMQLGAYAHAYTEERGYEFADVGIVNVGKDGVLSLLTAGDLGITVDDCERAFAFAVRLHDWTDKLEPMVQGKDITSCLSFPPKAKVEAR